MGRRKNKPAEIVDDTELTDGKPDDQLAENDDALGDEDDDGEADPIPTDPDHPAPVPDPGPAGTPSPGAPTAPAAAAPPAAGAGDQDDPLEDAVTEFGGYLHHEAKRSVKAQIVSRSSADRNVVTLKLKDGTIHESVPMWNEEGPRPTFPVWIE